MERWLWHMPRGTWQRTATFGGLGVALLAFVGFMVIGRSDAIDYILNPRPFNKMVPLEQMEFYSVRVGREYSAVCRSPELLRYFERLLFCSERSRAQLANDGTRFAGNWLNVTFKDGASTQRIGASFDLSNDQMRVEVR